MRRTDIARLEIDVPTDRRKKGEIKVQLRNGNSATVPFSMGSSGGLVLEALMSMIVTQIEADFSEL